MNNQDLDIILFGYWGLFLMGVYMLGMLFLGGRKE